MIIKEKLEILDQLDMSDSEALRKAIWVLCDCISQLDQRLIQIERRQPGANPLAWPPQ